MNETHNTIGAGLPATIANRREAPRVRLDWILYVNLESGNGGIVLDVSEKGMALQMADPLDPNEPLKFRLLSPALERTELAGDIKWIDETHRRGGVQFKNLPDNALDEIRSWAHASASPAAPGSHVSNPLPRASSVVQQRLEKRSSAEPAEPPAPLPRNGGMNAAPRHNGHTSSYASGLHSETAAAARTHDADVSPRADFPLYTRSLYAQHMEDTDPPWHWSATIIIVLILAATLGLLGYTYRSEVGRIVVTLGQKISGAKTSSVAQTPAESAPPAPNISTPAPSAATNAASPSANGDSPSPSSTTTANPSSEPSPNTAAPEPQDSAPAASPAPSADASQPNSISSGSDAASSATSPTSASAAAPLKSRTRQHAAPTKNSYPPAASTNERAASTTPDAGDGDGEAELDMARNYIDRGQSAAAAQALWLAVEKGNAEAEIELADLYGRGAGIQKNCQQARILVSAALDKADEIAAAESTRLNSYGCR